MTIIDFSGAHEEVGGHDCPYFNKCGLCNFSNVNDLPQRIYLMENILHDFNLDFVRMCLSLTLP